MTATITYNFITSNIFSGYSSLIVPLNNSTTSVSITVLISSSVLRQIQNVLLPLLSVLIIILNLIVIAAWKRSNQLRAKVDDTRHKYA